MISASLESNSSVTLIVASKLILVSSIVKSVMLSSFGLASCVISSLVVASVKENRSLLMNICEKLEM